MKKISWIFVGMMFLWTGITYGQEDGEEYDPELGLYKFDQQVNPEAEDPNSGGIPKLYELGDAITTIVNQK